MEMDNIGCTNGHRETCEVEPKESHDTTDALESLRFKECKTNSTFGEALVLFSQFTENRSDATVLPASGPDVQHRKA